MGSGCAGGWQLGQIASLVRKTVGCRPLVFSMLVCCCGLALWTHRWPRGSGFSFRDAVAHALVGALVAAMQYPLHC